MYVLVVQFGWSNDVCQEALRRASNVLLARMEERKKMVCTCSGHLQQPRFLNCNSADRDLRLLIISQTSMGRHHETDKRERKDKEIISTIQ